MIPFLLLISHSLVFGFNAPGIMPPESFIAERWYPSNLPTVMPPWKMPGIDISNFRTARPHQAPGTMPIITTTTPSAPTNSLPMPPGTSVPSVISETSINGPHPPAPSPQIEASGLTVSSEVVEEGSSLPASSTNSSSSEEVIILEDSTKITKNQAETIRILSPVFEDITKMDNISDVKELLDENNRSDDNRTILEGSGDDSSEFNQMSTTAVIIPFTKTSTEAEAITQKNLITTTKASESSISLSTESSSVLSTTELINTSSKLLTTTMKSLPKNHTRIETALFDDKTNEAKQRPTKDCRDILFLLDSSGNVVQQYEKQKKYIEEIVVQLEKSNPRRMALITYAGKTRQKIVVPLPEEPNGNHFLDKLKKARFLRGVTATGAAISVTTQYVLQKKRNVQVVVVTDGFSFDDVDHQSEALRTVIGNHTLVTGRYFPIVRNVLLSIGGTENKIFFEKREKLLIEELQC